MSVNLGLGWPLEAAAKPALDQIFEGVQSCQKRAEGEGRNQRDGENDAQTGREA